MQNELVEDIKQNETTINTEETTANHAQSDGLAKKEKYAKKIETNKEIINTLIEKFPLCFGKDDSVKPLKLGIFQDVVENEEIAALYSKTNIRAALRYYTMSWRYLEAVSKGGARIDLAGESVGIVDEQQQQHAETQLAEAKARVKSRQAVKKANEQKTQPKTKRNPNKLATKNNKSNQHNSAKENKIKAQNSGVDEKAGNSPLQKINKKPLEQESLQVGKKVNVLIGQSYSQAEILEINKDNVRVSLLSGLTLNVKIDNLSE
ncbi:RNA chaperone ProQ [Thorsellia kenyensis]|uniref:RNA chaperone ProQ n=1 Tax=Thorsellia kenyensis TaxID=1549888 RepID=A0ABV6CCC0_9GAMM